MAWREVDAELHLARCPEYTACDRSKLPRYCIHTHGGLESLAADEVRALGSCSEIVPLPGKVLFASTAELAALRRLRSAECLSLVVFCSPPPAMPEAAEADGAPDLASGSADGEIPAPNGGRAQDGEMCWRDIFAAFYASLPSDAARRWLRRLDAELRERILPALRAAEAHWRRAVGHAPGAPVRFRASVKRSGEGSRRCGVTSQLMEKLLGGLAREALGWEVDLRRDGWDACILLSWSGAHVVLEVPLTA
jgi:hypothetical protein